MQGTSFGGDLLQGAAKGCTEKLAATVGTQPRLLLKSRPDRSTIQDQVASIPASTQAALLWRDTMNLTKTGAVDKPGKHWTAVQIAKCEIR